MAKKKGTAEPILRRAQDVGWDKIGEMIGKKMEKGFKGDECCKGWGKWAKYGNNGDSGFFGRVLFIVGLYLALSALGLLHGIATWVLVLIGIGFALMRF